MSLMPRFFFFNFFIMLLHIEFETVTRDICGTTIIRDRGKYPYLVFHVGIDCMDSTPLQ